MCRKLAFAATAVALLVASPALAWPKKTPAAPAAATSPATPAQSQSALLPAPVKASAEERAVAERGDPLSRSAFWAREVRLDPRDATAGLKLSAALRALGQYSQAAEAAQAVSMIEPGNIDALLETARAHVAGKNGFYAIAPAERAQQLAPKDWRAPSVLGVAYEQVGRDAEAKASYDRALALSPNNAGVLTNLALLQTRKGDIVGAEKNLRRAAASPGSTIQVRQNLAYVLGLAGKLGEAELLMRQDLPPQTAANNLAYLKGLAPAQPQQPAAPRSWDSLRNGG